MQVVASSTLFSTALALVLSEDQTREASRMATNWEHVCVWKVEYSFQTATETRCVCAPGRAIRVNWVFGDYTHWSTRCEMDTWTSSIILQTYTHTFHTSLMLWLSVCLLSPHFIYSFSISESPFSLFRASPWTMFKYHLDSNWKSDSFFSFYLLELSGRNFHN